MKKPSKLVLGVAITLVVAFPILTGAEETEEYKGDKSVTEEGLDIASVFIGSPTEIYVGDENEFEVVAIYEDDSSEVIAEEDYEITVKDESILSFISFSEREKDDLENEEEFVEEVVEVDGVPVEDMDENKERGVVVADEVGETEVSVSYGNVESVVTYKVMEVVPEELDGYENEYEFKLSDLEFMNEEDPEMLNDILKVIAEGFEDVELEDGEVLETPKGTGLSVKEIKEAMKESMKSDEMIVKSGTVEDDVLFYYDAENERFHIRY